MTAPAPHPEAAVSDAVRAELDERYGRTRSPARRWIAGAAIVVAAALIGWFGWSTVVNSLNTVTAATTGFVVVDERTVSVAFQITAPVDRDVACIVEAQDEQHGIVGWKVVVLPGSAEHTRAFTETVPTTALATTGLINSCWVT